MKKEKDPELAELIQRNRKSHPALRWLVLLIVLAAAGIAWQKWNKRKSEEARKTTYQTTRVEKGNVALTITTTGTLEPTNQITIGSEVSGTVIDVYVDINDRVTKGQALAKLDPTKLTQQTERSRAALRAATASVSQARASLKEAQANLNRLTELHQRSGGRTPSQADLDAATASVDRSDANLQSAQAQVAQNDAELKANESDLAKAVLTSPVDGIVLTRSIEPGQTVAAQFQAPELFVIAENLARMKLIVNVAEADIGRVEANQNATFTVDAWPKRNYSAEVKTVSFGSSVTDNVVTYETELEVPNEDLSLRPGMTATAEIAVAESTDVLLVSNAALRYNPEEGGSNQGGPQGMPGGGPQSGGGAPKKSFLESLTPGPPRNMNRKPSEDLPEPPEGGPQQIWILRDGKPEAIPVQVGISDGRQTEISGPFVEKGLEVILSSFSGS